MRTKLAVLAAAGLAAGAGAAWLAGQNRNFVPYQTVGVPACLLVGWSFIGCGLIARQQRPGNWLGPVMIFVGFAWFATFLTDANGLIVEPDLPSAPSAPSPAQPGSAMPG